MSKVYINMSMLVCAVIIKCLVKYCGANEIAKIIKAQCERTNDEQTKTIHASISNGWHN